MGAGLRVLVVDDHPVYRDGLAALLASVDGVEVVGTAADGRELAPDVVIMDIQMPVLEAIVTAREAGLGRPS